MVLWLLLMLVGLAVLGVVFYKVWTAQEGGVERKWLAAALVGTLISVVGLVMTLRSLQKSPEVGVPQARLGVESPAGPTGEQGLTLPSAAQQRPPQVPPGQTPPGQSSSGIPKFDASQYPEDPTGERFTAEEGKQFTAEVHRILDELEKQVTIENERGKNEEKAAKANRWMLYNMDHENWLDHFRNESMRKQGPGSGRVRQLVFGISASLQKMERVYHNAAVWGDELDVSYIADLREEVERLSKELERETSGQPQ